MKKNILLFIFATILGVYLSKYIYNGYQNEKVKTVSSSSNDIYIYQYQAYNNKDVMIENTKFLKNYFYYEKDNLFHVIIGISLKDDKKDKLKKAYNIDSDIYVFKEKISNSEFITNLKEYDKLIISSDDSDTIINAEKQIMAKYEELILRNE